MKLYYSPGACSLAPHIVAREASIEIELVRVDLATKTTERGDDFRAINLKGSIPALTLNDGSVLTEGPVICQFIADLRPSARLLAHDGTLDRYRALEWLNFIATELHKGFSLLVGKDTSTELREFAVNRLRDKFGYVDRHLCGRDYLLDRSFCVADAYAYTILSWAPLAGIDLSQWPDLAAYVARISARTSVRAALAAEGLLDRLAA